MKLLFFSFMSFLTEKYTFKSIVIIESGSFSYACVAQAQRWPRGKAGKQPSQLHSALGVSHGPSSTHCASSV